MATSSRTVPTSSPRATQVAPPAADQTAPDADRAADHSQLIEEIDESGARTVIFALDHDGKTVVARAAPGAALRAQTDTVSVKTASFALGPRFRSFSGRRRTHVEADYGR